MESLKQKQIKKMLSFIVAFAILLCAIPLSGAVKALAMSEGEIIYLDVHSDANNSATGEIYKSGGRSVRYLKTRETEKICYCIQPGVVFTRTRYKVMRPTSDPYYTGLNKTAQENVALVAQFGFPTRTAAQLGVSTNGDAYAATQALIWQYITGQESYKNGIIGSPAEKAYNNILSAIAAYKADKRYSGTPYNNPLLFTLETATASVEQAVICYEGKTPTYPPIISEGSIEIYKKDEYSAPLSGAYFTAVNTSDSSKVYSIGPTNNSGYAKTEKIPYGTYKIKESIFPSGYMSGGTSEWTVTLNDSTPNRTITINAVNKQIPGNCKIVKTSEDGKVDGIAFKIEGNGISKTVTTANGGQIQIDGLKPAVYTVTEITDNVYEPQEVRRVTVVSGQTATVTFNNKLKRGKLTVTKTAEDGLTAGIKFHLYGTSLSGLAVDEYAITDSSGKAYFKDVLIGRNYTLEETETAQRYVIPEIQSVNIEWNATAEKEVYNSLKKWQLTVTKSDKQTGSSQGNATLFGAVYGLYKGEQLIDTYTTDKNGCFTTKYYACGSDWSIREISASNGYLVTPERVKIGAEAERYALELNKTALDVTESVIKGTVAVIKHCDDGSTKIETPEVGATFEIFLTSVGSYKNAKDTERDILVCDKDGFANSKALPYGTYTVHQTKGLDGRELMPDFTVKIAEDGKCYKYLINNANFTAYLKVVKVDSETGKTIPYAGAAFEIYNPDGELVEMTTTYPNVVKHTQFETNKEGYLITPEVLDYGKRYSIIEVSAPHGYVIDRTPVYFDIMADNSEIADGITVVKTEKKNAPQKGIISIYKSGEVFSSVTEKEGIYTPIFAEAGLNGSEFDIIANEDIYTPDGTLRYNKDEIVDHIVTTNGNAESKPLYLGKYRIIETKASYGMVLSKEALYAELTYAGQEVELTSTAVAMYNHRQKATVSLEKILEKDELFNIGMGGEIKGISFGLFAADKLTAADGSYIPKDGLLEKVFCDENGKISFKADIPVGAKLYVQELTTNEHYILSSEKHLIQFDYAEQTVTLVEIKVNNDTAIKNNLIYGTVKGYKVDEGGNPIKGAVFGLFKNDETDFTEKNALMLATSGEDGIFIFEKVVFGNWLIKEIKTASAKYVPNDTVYKAEITEDGAVIEYKIVNRFIRGSVTVTKVDEEYPENKLSGAVFEIYLDVDGDKKYTAEVDTIIGEMTESELGVYRMDKLKYGGYFLYEKVAPDKFVKLNDYFYFEINTDGEVKAVENLEGIGLANKPIVGSIKIVKSSTDNKVEGFSFRVTGENGYDKIFKTDKNGEILIEGLRLGKYTISEISDDVSAGYILAEDKTVFVVADTVVTAKMHNEKKPEIPQTSDNLHIGLYFLMMLASLSVLIFLSVKIRKRKTNKEVDFFENM